MGLFLFFFSDFYQEEQGNQDAIRTVIFLVLLPPIMFEDGYNFPKRKFVQNIFYVNLYGLIGTILNFVTVWGLLTLFNNFSTPFMNQACSLVSATPPRQSSFPTGRS